MTTPIRQGVASGAPLVQTPVEDSGETLSQVDVRSQIPGAHPSGSVNSIVSGAGSDAAVMTHDMAPPYTQSPSGPVQQVLQALVKLIMELVQMLRGQQQQPPSGIDPLGGQPGSPSVLPDPSVGAPGIVPTNDPTAGVPGPTSSGNPSVGAPTPVTVRPYNPANVPEINQFSPVGAQNGYSNGPANCGPASVAMLCRSLGLGSGVSDAQYVNQLGAIGGTTSQGSSINGIVAMAQSQGLQGQIDGPTADLNWIDSQLSAGHPIIANGDYSAEPGHAGPPSGHYLDIVGKNSDGTYQVRDPADASEKSFTASQVTAFINANQTNGGYCVSVWK